MCVARLVPERLIQISKDRKTEFESGTGDEIVRYWESRRYGTPDVSHQVVEQSQVVTIKFGVF